MRDILLQLQQLFVQSIPTVIFVFILLAILDRLFFRPLTRLLQQREDATFGALARAREQVAAAEAKWREYAAAIHAARQELYRLREEERRAALSERDAAIKKTRAQAESYGNEAQGKLRDEVAAAKLDLEKTARALGTEIAEALVGGGDSRNPEGVPR